MYRLVSFDVRPYVQRSGITLEEKGILYEIEYIDIINKPDRFLQLSLLGKVTILIVEDTVSSNRPLSMSIWTKLHPAAGCNPQSRCNGRTIAAGLSSRLRSLQHATVCSMRRSSKRHANSLHRSTVNFSIRSSGSEQVRFSTEKRSRWLMRPQHPSSGAWPG